MRRTVGIAVLAAGLGWPALAQQAPELPSEPGDAFAPPAIDQQDAAPPLEQADPQTDPLQPQTPPPEEADPSGVPPVDEAPPAEPVPPGDPLREPIERQPLPEPTTPVPPLPETDLQRRPDVTRDRGYVAPRPPAEERPQITIDEVVRNPIRIYEVRLLVLSGPGGCSAATEALGILTRRFPTDARVAYLNYFALFRSGSPEAALDALRRAVSLERLYPIPDYDRFMEPLQGPDRLYVERVRRAAAELARVESLVEPDPNELIPEEPVPPPDASDSGRRPEPAADSPPPSDEIPPERDPVPPAEPGV